MPKRKAKNGDRVLVEYQGRGRAFEVYGEVMDYDSDDGLYEVKPLEILSHWGYGAIFQYPFVLHPAARHIKHVAPEIIETRRNELRKARILSQAYYLRIYHDRSAHHRKALVRDILTKMDKYVENPITRYDGRVNWYRIGCGWYNYGRNPPGWLDLAA